MENKIKSFTDLKVWQEGHQLVILIYKITKKFPQKDVDYLDQKDFQELSEKINNTHRLLQGLITKSKTFLDHKS